MKCLAAIDSIICDIIYLDCDTEFARFLQAEACKRSDDDGQYFDPDSPDLDVATMFFIPFSQTQNLAYGAGNPVHSVMCQDGLVMALHRFDNIDVFCVNGEGANNETALMQCVMFEKVVKLHLGPATLFLKPGDLVLRRTLWNKIAGYLDSWNDAIGLSDKYLTTDDQVFSQLCEENFKQHFMFQAVEELHINAELKKQAADLVVEALESAQRIDRSYCQAILVVNGKVLFSHSTKSAQRLDPSDLLFILFIAHCSLPKSPVNVDYGSSLDLREMKYHQQTIFIRKLDQNDHYMPCTLTAVSIRAGIVLILLAETRLHLNRLHLNIHIYLPGPLTPII